MSRLTLNETTLRATTGPNFRGQLHEPQQAVLHTMRKWEQKQLVRITRAAAPDTKLAEQFNAARLACKFGSGKTVMSVALICEAPLPRQMPIIDSYASFLNVPRQRASNRKDAEPLLRSCKCVSEWYPDVCIPATLIVASASVISQWEEHLWRFAPHIPFLTVGVSSDFAEFKDVLENQNFAWRVVLLKLGKTNYGLPLEKRQEGHSNTTLHAMRTLCGGRVWSRLMVDDYDTIGLRKYDPTIPAFFTWYISASAQTTDWYLGEENWFPILGAVRDTPAIDLAESFLKTMITLPPPQFYSYELAPTTGLKLLAEFANDGEFLDAVKSGAYGEAGNMTGLRCNSVAQLFMGLLGKNIEQFNRYKVNTEVLANLKSMYPGTSGKPMPKIAASSFVGDVVHGRDDGTGSNQEKDLSQYSDFTHVHSAINQRTGKLATRIRDIQQRIDRLKHNFEEQTCQVCYLEDDLKERIIMGCCQLVICPVCFGVDGKGVNGHCPGCSEKIASVLIVNEAIDIQDISEESCSKAISAPVAATGAAAQKSVFDHLEPKPKLLVSMLMGEPTVAPTVGDWSIDNLITGAAAGTLPDDPPDGVRRVLLYYGHSGACDYIKSSLDSCDVPFEILRGTPNARKAIIKNFTKDDPAPVHGKKFKLLLLFAETSAAGIHLPEATDIIFFTHFRSGALLQQVAGRGQRPGRKCRLRIHRFQYTM